MRIAGPDITTRDGTATWSCRIRFDNGAIETLWYSVPKEYDCLLSDRLDAALVALLIPAMRRSAAIQLDGPVAAELVHHVEHGLQQAFMAIMPELSAVAVTAMAPEGTSSPRARGVATGFSGGVDSFCVLADNYLGKVPESLRVTHLLFNNVGSHGRDGADVFAARYGRLEPLVDAFGLPFVQVNSNLDDFYADGFEQTHTPRNASVALVLQQGIGRFLYASAYPYADIGAFPTSSMAHADPITLPMMSTPSSVLLPSGSEYTRVAKTMRVAEIPESYATLDVCTRPGSPGRNCSRCSKCMRTMLTMEIGGVLSRYRESFDLQEYERTREQYMTTVLASRDPLPMEIVEFAKTQGFAFPWSSRRLVPLAIAKPAVRGIVHRHAPQWVRRLRKRATGR